MVKYIAHITFSRGTEVVHIGAYEVEVDYKDEIIEKRDIIINSIVQDLEIRGTLMQEEYDSIEVDFQSESARGN